MIASDALRPGLGTAYEARCGAGAVAYVLGADGGNASLGARVTRTKPFVDRYRGDGELDNRDLYDARLFREQIFLPAVGEVADALTAFAVTAWSLPDPDGRLGGVVAKRVGSGSPAVERDVRGDRRSRRRRTAARRRPGLRCRRHRRD